ncbi:type I restriction endonuclease subunit R [Vibrio cholerae]|nr:type I restriction endonuclease subunit R [Vibrio cholerae]
MNREIEFQRNIINFLTSPVSQGGLGYEEANAQTVTDDLVIPSVAKRWFSQGRNKVSYEKLKKRAKSDSWIGELIKEVQSRISRSQYNIAEFLLRNKSITFEGQEFYLYVVSNNDNEEFFGEKMNESGNIFTVVEEVVYKRNPDGVSSRRPDLCFFINGFYFSYLEIKNLDSSGSFDRGIDKILTNYAEAHGFVSNSDEKSDSYRHALQLWSQPCSIISLDNSDASVARNLHGELKKDARSLAKDKYGSYTQIDYYNKGRKLFKRIITSSRNKSGIPILKLSDTLKEVLTSYYSKHSVYNEIAYYNFVESSAVEKSNSVPISPRPKQKFGVDRTISRITTLLKHESDPDFLINEILNHESVAQRNQHEKDALIYEYNSISGFNKINSILLQYSAGFGKTNIMAWLAGRIKNLQFDAKPAYEKVFLVADRLDLKDQINNKLNSMPGMDNSSFAEIGSKDELVEALDSTSKKVIIINIQKFRSAKAIQKLLLESNIARTNKRYAFIIDEVHRSNSGDQHQNMMSIFSDAVISKKVKNLVIGLTATPSEEVLARFGSFHSYKEKRCAFDAFTMKEAIDEGFVLNPVDGLVKPSFKVVVDSDKSEIDAKSESYDFKKEDIYENPKRAKAIVKHSTRMMFDNIFDRINPKGQTSRGKAMFACHSVKAAQMYYQIFDEEFLNSKIKLLEDLGASDRLIQKVKEKQDINDEDMLPFNKNKRKDILKRLQARVYVVYTSNKNAQDCIPKESHTLCGFSNEKEVIKHFKSSLNGLIIVVKKLQTGFDDPNLHTLFLDRNIKDIEAVQTCCRVNRTAKGKEDCLVIDWTHENSNIEEIKRAFKKYENLTISGKIVATDILGEIEGFHKNMRCDDGIKKLLAFARNHSGRKLDEKFQMEVEDVVVLVAKDVEKRVSDRKELKEYLKEFVKPIVGYVNHIEKYKVVVDIDKKYLCHIQHFVLRMFLSKLRAVKESKDLIPINVIIDDDDLAFMLEDVFIEDDVSASSSGSGKPVEVKSSISYISDLNRDEIDREDFKHWYFDQRDLVFDFIQDRNIDFVNIIKDGGRLEFDDFKAALMKVMRGNNAKKFGVDENFVKCLKEFVCPQKNSASTLYCGELKSEFEIKIKTNS